MLLVKMLSIFNKRIFKRKGPKLCTLAIHCAIVAPKKNCLTQWCLCASFFPFTCDVSLCLSPMCNTHILWPTHDLPVHSVTVESLWPPLYSHGPCWNDPTAPSLYPCLYSRSHLGRKKHLLYLCLVPLSDHKMVLCRLKKVSHLCIILNSLRVICAWLCAGAVHCKWQIYKLTCIVNLWICHFQTNPTWHTAMYKSGIKC